MDNQKGFVLPLTMILIFLLMALVMSLITTYQFDLHKVNQHQHMLAIDRLEQMVVKDVQADMNNGVLPNDKLYHYNEGTVHLSLSGTDGDKKIYQVVVKESTDNQRRNRLIVNPITKQIIVWQEAL